jgi:hypothetical protein
MSTEIHLKRENDRLRREISELKAKISELVPKQPEAPVAEKYDPFQPVKPGTDPVWDMLRQQHPHNRKRGSWLDVT